MTDRLQVRLFDRHVGELGIAGEVRAPEDWRFTYAAEYLRETDPAQGGTLPRQCSR